MTAIEQLVCIILGYAMLQIVLVKYFALRKIDREIAEDKRERLLALKAWWDPDDFKEVYGDID